MHDQGNAVGFRWDASDFDRSGEPVGTDVVGVSVDGDSHGVGSGPDRDIIDPMLSDLIFGLSFLRAKQRPFLEGYGHLNLDKDTITRYALALSIEVAEFANELPWKRWKEYPEEEQEERKQRILEEFVDVLHFIGTWGVLLGEMGISSYQIADEFVKKNQKNHDRMNGKAQW